MRALILGCGNLQRGQAPALESQDPNPLRGLLLLADASPSSIKESMREWAENKFGFVLVWVFRTLILLNWN